MAAGEDEVRALAQSHVKANHVAHPAPPARDRRGAEQVSGGGEAAKPVIGCTAATAIETWAKYHGDDKPGFAEFCKAQKPGKPSKAYTISDWADIVNAIEAAQNAAAEPEAGSGATEDDDLSF